MEAKTIQISGIKFFPSFHLFSKRESVFCVQIIRFILLVYLIPTVSGGSNEEINFRKIICCYVLVLLGQDTRKENVFLLLDWLIYQCHFRVIDLDRVHFRKFILKISIVDPNLLSSNLAIIFTQWNFEQKLLEWPSLPAACLLRNKRLAFPRLHPTTLLTASSNDSRKNESFQSEDSQIKTNEPSSPKK